MLVSRVREGDVVVGGGAVDVENVDDCVVDGVAPLDWLD